MKQYNPKEIETKWQEYWKGKNFYKAEKDESKKKFYCLEMFPYPSGKLHMGHMRVYSIGDVLARFLTMRGFNVLHPMGWDAFGLPAENAARERQVHPGKWTYANVAEMKKQQDSLGLSYDWDREVTSCHPDYYKWSQWLFLLFYKRGLAYRKKAAVNWCPECQTVLANEQVEDGKCWRCESSVDPRDLEQWFFKITDYADRLLEDLDLLDGWPDRVKIMQQNWIGRSTGGEIVFNIKDREETIPVFTTRPDTLFGVTYMVLAPEHPLVGKLSAGKPEEAKVKEFVTTVNKMNEITRTSTETEKEGVFTGAYAINPANGEEVPILVGNYVLMGYGTGAVMGVPAHDERDFIFAKKYDLPIRVVINPSGESLSVEEMETAYTEYGVLVNSGQFDGQTSEDAIKNICAYLEDNGTGSTKVTYRLRDWLISRQRYWGAPIPVIYCDKCGMKPVPEKDLPVLLPEEVNFRKEGGSPLEEMAAFKNTTCPDCGGQARRETDTMDTFICSSWYFLRYASPHATEAPFNKEDADYWLPVDQYIGGIEHAILHLMYARFFTKVLYDAGMVSTKEPFTRLLAQGMVNKDGAKMSKSKGNVVSPDEIIEEYGADTGRLFILFAAPPEKSLDWNDRGVEGCYRFLKRVWRVVNDNLEYIKDVEFPAKNKKLSKKEKDLRFHTHSALQKVTVDIEERFNFNTAISAIMELVNETYTYLSEGKKDYSVLKETIETIVILIAPFAPHIAEEMWHLLGHKESVHQEEWPAFDKEALTVEEVEIVVQINGKVRGKLKVPTDADKDKILALAKEQDNVKQYLEKGEIRKVIVVPGKLLNMVVK